MENMTFDKPLKIDTRPLWLIVIDRTARYQIFAVMLALFVIMFQISPPAGLSLAGYHSLIVFAACVAIWVSGLLPLAVTSLLAMAMLPLLGIMEAKKTYALFGNEAVFFILGAFILAAAMTGSGLSARLARAMLVRFGRTSKGLALTVFMLSALLSFCMSEHAVAAMMFSVTAEIVRSLELREDQRNYGKLLFMAIGWGCVIGGVATFLGGLGRRWRSGCCGKIQVSISPFSNGPWPPFPWFCRFSWSGSCCSSGSSLPNW